MKLLFFILILASCSTSKLINRLNPLYQSSCFIVYDIQEKSYLIMSNEEDCHREHAAASTFKIPLAVMAFETRIIQDSLTAFKWDGKKRMLDAWNKDQTAASWMQESVVWVSQKITPKIGQQKIEKFLKSFNYGNHDMSGGVMWAWLTPGPVSDDPVTNTLQVSGTSQTHFLENLWNETLPVTKESQQKTKDLLVMEVLPSGAILRGKTGSAHTGLGYDLRIGWWVGYLHSRGKSYVVVSNFVDKKAQTGEKTFGGREAKANAIKQISDLKL